MTKAIFPGTFDPFTVGHYSVVRRALTFIDEIVIGIGINDNKNTHFPIAEREAMIRDLYKNEPRVSVQAYDSLTIDFARQVGANLIIRGIRTVKDFEYEETIADINRKLTGIERDHPSLHRARTFLRQLHDSSRANGLRKGCQHVPARRYEYISRVSNH